MHSLWKRDSIKKLLHYFKYDNVVTSEVYFAYCRVVIGMGNIFKYLPIVWKDRQWDYNHLYELLQFKLKLMYKEFAKDDVYVGQGKDAKKIKFCIDILDRILKNEYHENVFRDHDRKWGEQDFDLSNGKFRRTRENILTEEDEEKERKEFLKLMGHVGYLTEQDKRILFETITKHIESWWI